MRRYLTGYKHDLLIALGLLLLPLLFFWPVAVGNRTLLPADSLFSVEPWRSAALSLRSRFRTTPCSQTSSWRTIRGRSSSWNRWRRASCRCGIRTSLPGCPSWPPATLSVLSVFHHLLSHPLPRAYGLFTVSQFFWPACLPTSFCATWASAGWAQPLAPSSTSSAYSWWSASSLP